MDFCNKHLEYEFITSLFLKGVIYPKEFVDLHNNVCNLKILDATNDLSTTLLELQKKLVTKTGFLKESILKPYYLGTDDSLLGLFQTAYTQSNFQEKVYEDAVKEHLLQISEQMENITNNLKDYEDMANAVHSANLENEVVKQRDQINYDLKIINASLKNILNLYAAGNPFSTKEKYTEYSDKYRLFLADLDFNLTDIVSDPLLSMILYTAINEIKNNTPKDNLDVYGKDKFKNLIGVLLNPQDYYTKCTNEEIDSPQVAQSCYKVYPEYMEMYLDMYLDKYNEFDQQKQINFRKCFNLIENQGQLISMCLSSFTNNPQPIK